VAADADLELVERARSGDRDAFGRLADRHHAWVLRVCLRFLRSDDAARDAAQEVFTRALDRFETFRGDNFAGWLKVIAVNTCLNVIDREKRWAPLDPAQEPASAAAPPDARLLASERQAQVRRLIARLPAKQKIVFCLKYLDECSYHDIERLTGFSGKEVKSFLQNARRNVENWAAQDTKKTKGTKGTPWSTIG
jgi:RNA polymerase sigma-70 factor (ECF subfamily)